MSKGQKQRDRQKCQSQTIKRQGFSAVATCHSSHLTIQCGIRQRKFIHIIRTFHSGDNVYRYIELKYYIKF